jgi:hypothetical protein
MSHCFFVPSIHKLKALARAESCLVRSGQYVTNFEGHDVEIYAKSQSKLRLELQLVKALINPGQMQIGQQIC